MAALKLELSIRAAATRTGGGGPPVLASDGVLLTAFNNTLEIRDTVTPANAYKAVPSGKIVTTRASSASYYDSAGLVQTAAVSVHRLDNDPRIGQPGFLTEDTRTNVVLWSNDLTNVAWVKTNTAAVKDQVGPDGVANSASKLTASAANGTALQTTTVASTARYQSAYVKRVTGTGVVEMTMDNGTTWTAIAVTAAWTRVDIPPQTLANPPVGFRIATSGDAVAVYGVQNENSNFASSVITTTTAATTRAADLPKLAIALFPYNAAEGTLYAKAIVMGDQVGSSVAVAVDDGTAGKHVSLQRNYVSKKPELLINDTTIQANIIATAVQPAMAAFKASTGFKLNDTQAAFSGDVAKTVDIGCTMPAVNVLIFGAKSTAASTLNGWLFEAMYLPTRLTNQQLMDLVA